MKFLIFLALAVAFVAAQDFHEEGSTGNTKVPPPVGLEEQAREKRQLLLQTYPALQTTLYRNVLPTTYASYYPYVYPYTNIHGYYNYPYIYYK